MCFLLLSLIFIEYLLVQGPAPHTSQHCIFPYFTDVKTKVEVTKASKQQSQVI